MATKKAASIDEYIADFPAETQKLLEQVRQIVKHLVPGAEEAISYSIPAFNINKTYLVYMSGNKKHISLYPAPTGDENF
jgi:uncharacterized protein YdhG (YjbR/CyaY superfamily)